MTAETMAARPVSPSIRIKLAFFKDFPTVAGLLRTTGARRVASREFVIEGDMTIAQVVALMQLLQHSRRRESSDPVTIEVTPRLDSHRFDFNELDAWWGTVQEPNWL